MDGLRSPRFPEKKHRVSACAVDHLSFLSHDTTPTRSRVVLSAPLPKEGSLSYFDFFSFTSSARRAKRYAEDEVELWRGFAFFLVMTEHLSGIISCRARHLKESPQWLGEELEMLFSRRTMALVLVCSMMHVTMMR